LEDHGKNEKVDDAFWVQPSTTKNQEKMLAWAIKYCLTIVCLGCNHEHPKGLFDKLIPIINLQIV